MHEATKTATLSGPVMGHKSVVACSKETGQRRRSILVRALNHRTQKSPIYKYFYLTLAPNCLVPGGDKGTGLPGASTKEIWTTALGLARLSCEPS